MNTGYAQCGRRDKGSFTLNKRESDLFLDICCSVLNLIRFSVNSSGSKGAFTHNEIQPDFLL